MKNELIQMAGLECRHIHALPDSKPADVVCIVNHGYGANAEDLAPLAMSLFTEVPDLADSVAFAFPDAPLSLAEKGYPPECRAWWHLDMEKITASIARGELRDQRNSLPAELPASREALQGVVAEMRQQWDLPPSKVVLAGFSQGSMLATDVALRSEETVGGLVVWSGTLLCESEWRNLAARHTSLPVFQSHGTQDMILPFVAAEWLRDMFHETGIDAEFHSFPGVHTIPPGGFAGLVKILRTAISD